MDCSYAHIKYDFVGIEFTSDELPQSLMSSDTLMKVTDFPLDRGICHVDYRLQIF